MFYWSTKLFCCSFPVSTGILSVSSRNCILTGLFSLRFNEHLPKQTLICEMLRKAGVTEASCLVSCIPTTQRLSHSGVAKGTICWRSALTPEYVAQGISHGGSDCSHSRIHCPRASISHCSIFSLVPHLQEQSSKRTFRHDAYTRGEQGLSTDDTHIVYSHIQGTSLWSCWVSQSCLAAWNLVLTRVGLLLYFSICLHPAVDCLYLQLLANGGWTSMCFLNSPGDVCLVQTPSGQYRRQAGLCHQQRPK